jgi:diguanylate cyclase
LNRETEMLIAVFAAQAVLALALSALFFLFFRDLRHAYLRHWGLSFLAMALYMVSSGVVIYLLGHAVSVATRTAVSALSMAALYAQVALLLAGVFALGRQRPLNERRVALFVLAITAVGACSTLVGAFDPEAASLRVYARVGMRYLFLGVAFSLAAWVIWHHSRGAAVFGARFLSFVMLLYALHLFHSLLVQILAMAFDYHVAYLVYMPIGDLVAYALMGLGLVTWLLQQERQQSQHAQNEASRLSLYDPLTNLPNRRNLKRRLSRAMARLKDTDLRIAFAYVDVERFRRLNDSLGHARGDEVLKTLADRLTERLPEDATVARVGADEFAFILPELRGDEEARSRLAYLLEAIREPIVVAGRDIHLNYSCGYALFPVDGEDEQTLMRAADLAHSRARQWHGELLLRYQAGMESDASERLTMESDLRRALSQDEMRVYFQPIMGRDGQVFCVEALARWQHPERGLVVPNDFLPMIATLGLAPQLDYWVLEQSCRQLAEWRREGLDIRIAVNLSASLLEQPELPARVERILRRTGVPAALLQLEITEQVAMNDTHAGNATLDRLRAVGIGLSLDDFGTGYSSLSWLRQFPVDRLKIDRCFISEMDDEQGLAIVESVIGLAHALGLSVTAEGVESLEQWRSLHALDCDHFQGFHFSRALPPDELPAFVRRASLHLVDP